MKKNITTATTFAPYRAWDGMAESIEWTTKPCKRFLADLTDAYKGLIALVKIRDKYGKELIALRDKLAGTEKRIADFDANKAAGLEVNDLAGLETIRENTAKELQAKQAVLLRLSKTQQDCIVKANALFDDLSYAAYVEAVNSRLEAIKVRDYQNAMSSTLIGHGINNTDTLIKLSAWLAVTSDRTAAPTSKCADVVKPLSLAQWQKAVVRHAVQSLIDMGKLTYAACTIDDMALDRMYKRAEAELKKAAESQPQANKAAEKTA